MNPDTLSKQVQLYLADGGELSQKIPGFEPRQAQIALAEKLVEVIETDGTFLAEAGTGTGKTYAYLLPALLSGKTVIISTATKNLQEQLVEKDLPLLLKTLKIKGHVQLLKGRENYLCPQRLELAQTAEANTKAVWAKLNKIQHWSEKTKVGDKAELTELDENDPVWSRVCSRMEFCQAADCHPETQCFYPKIKQQANEAQILVVNHHLFCADLALRENGYGEILPEAEIVIFDEAHKLPDIAAQFLGFSLSRHQLDDLARDAINALKMESPESQEVMDKVKGLEETVVTFCDALGKWEKRWTWEMFENDLASLKMLKRLLNHLTQVADNLKPLTERGKQIQAVHRRAQEFEKQLSHWLKAENEFQIRWLESSQARFKLNLTPLSVAGPFSRHREEMGGAWIFTSATLSVNGQFSYFANRLGLEDADNACWDSPFDYDSQGLIYHPIGLPQPRDPDYIKICLRAIWPLLAQTEGRAFLLFTSHKALQEAREILLTHWQGTLLVQGDAPKSALLQRFRESEKALLLGTSSFWEGVDVKGEALKVVMIDRIPFAPPDDPIVQAREAYLKEKGLHGFVNFQLPEAIIAMKQGAGRLIRDVQDTGILVLCDPRLSQKPYGKVIAKSLPSFPWVYDVQTVLSFLKENDKSLNSKQEKDA
ncbi:ATP-dependent DNA helicase [Thiosulfativibrio zosterae]|uniref:ATP-dependent helicase n=1 Tax=Thiosulfativibrio zosterae TaxID=2675053 RepID=A0A6F8PP10_9GAMM|nr:ATP-dependent DNA helicase [Thiosulfativibrio zosterae]BBP43784.1 ATP-dependent helicase [Thiosulfativibrio zosterae]